MRHPDPDRPAAGRPTVPHPGHAGHVLVVEDDECSAELNELICRHAGYRVSRAADGREALALLATTLFDMVLLDVRLPDMSGVEVLRRVRASEALAHLSVAFVTAVALPAERRSLMAVRPTDIVYKPFRRKDLLDCVTRHVPPPLADAGLALQP